MSEDMEVDEVVKGLNRALALQRRSVLSYATASGSMFGLDVQGLTAQLWSFAEHELLDLRRIVEKITALGGDPTTDIPSLDWSGDPRATVQGLVETEEEVIAALHAVIPHSGQKPDSEALEHLMEHLIMRKQNQVDSLKRALREP